MIDTRPRFSPRVVRARIHWTCPMRVTRFLSFRVILFQRIVAVVSSSLQGVSRIHMYVRRILCLMRASVCGCGWVGVWCVCMCVCVCVRGSVHRLNTRVCTRICTICARATHTYTHGSSRHNMYVCTCARARARAHTHTHTHTYVPVCECVINMKYNNINN